MQILAEVITVGQAMAFTVPFVLLALIAIWLTVRLFRSFSEVLPATRTVQHKKGKLNEGYSISK